MPKVKTVRGRVCPFSTYGQHVPSETRKGVCSACDGVTDSEWHQQNAILAQTEPERAMEELDARYHDDLPEFTNCRACGIEHSPITGEA